MEFPTTFESHVKKIHKLLFHVLAHIYHAHFKEVVLLQLHAHLNALFAHFVEFNLRFPMVEDKELEVSIYLKNKTDQMVVNPQPSPLKGQSANIELNQLYH